MNRDRSYKVLLASRLLGTYLRWMQDHSGEIFTVATANNISSLPPELLRKGRFDQIFFVDLPDPASRREIFRVHLAKRGVNPETLDIDHLVDETRGFSGAEIETAIVGARYRAAADGGSLTVDQLDTELSSTVPLSVTRAEDIAALRAWARERAMMA